MLLGYFFLSLRLIVVVVIVVMYVLFWYKGLVSFRYKGGD